MSVLDNRATIKHLDPNDFLGHIFDVPDQIIDGFNLAADVRLPALYAQSKQVVILASGEMRTVALSLMAMTLHYCRVPVVLVDDYILPHWVSSDTLVVALDYTGASEQVLVAFREASLRRARLLAVSVGGDLAKEARRVKAPHLQLSYGAPARIAFTFLFTSAVVLLRKLDLLEIKESIVSEASVLARSLLQNIGPDVPQFQNNAKQLAEKMASRPTIIVGSGPLIGAAERWQNNLAATAKITVLASTLGQFNDTIINSLGLKPKGVDSPMVLMLQSKYDYPRNKLQQTLCYQVAQARKLVYEQIFMHPSGSLFGEIILANLFGDIVSYYVSLLMGVDPTVTEASDFIRSHLVHQPLFES